MPEFLAIWNWSNIFINNLTENETIILDGAPRKLIEVEVLESAINFYDYKKVTIIYLNVSKDWAINRLASRGREDDDQKEEQERKMSWFESDVIPCIDLYKNKSEDIGSSPNQNNIDYNFIEINGEQSVEEVSAELISKLK
jgi:adenylate kinase family enzyme